MNQLPLFDLLDIEELVSFLQQISLVNRVLAVIDIQTGSVFTPHAQPLPTFLADNNGIVVKDVEPPPELEEHDFVEV